MQLRIETIDTQTAPEEDLKRLFELGTIIDQESLPDEPTAPFGEVLSRWRNRGTHSKRIDWLGWAGDDLIGSCALFYEDLEENKHLGWLWLQVHPAHRRRRIGTRLLIPVVDVMKSLSKNVLGSWTWQEGPGEGFLEALGTTKRMVERQGRLWMRDVDSDTMRSWVQRAAERASAYSLRFWEGRCPDDLLTPFAEAFNVMNTAPRDDLDYEDEKMTPDLMRERDDTHVAQGNPWWTSVAIHNPSGQIAGFTEIFLSGHRDDIAWQGNTGVDPNHRNQGLGRWLKADMFLRISENKPAITRIHTWNAGSNDAMLSINDAMGFHAAQWWSTWQAPLEVWESSIGKLLESQPT